MAFDGRESVELGSATFAAGDVLAELAKLRGTQFDLIVSSPPYNIGKSYESKKPLSLDEYTEWQRAVLVELTSVAAPNSSVCWQVGTQIVNGAVLPLDFVFHPLFVALGWTLRNRIIWRFNFGHNSQRRFSGRYETLLWFTRGADYTFNLDPVRIPQLYPGKRHAKTKGARAGLPSGNPKGKNPSDYWEFSATHAFRDDPVWDIPNVKANHPEYTTHPCQFPVELVERCVLALTNQGDRVLDPFVGTGSSVLASVKHGRHAVGIDKEAQFIDIAKERLRLLANDDLPLRPLGKPVRRPVHGEKVSTVPLEWSRP